MASKEPEKPKEPERPIATKETDLKIESAAAKIQALFRGWKQRKLYKENRRHAAFREKVSLILELSF